MREGPSLEYNQSIPSNWWTSSWRPSQFAYGINTYGRNWGADTDSTACFANNAYCMTYYLKDAGWSFLSACAMFGNIQGEGAFDPRAWEVYADPSRGFGLVQWTPMNQYTNPAQSVWGDGDDWAPLWWASGWYETYMICAEVFGTYRTQWVKHMQGPGHNPAPGSGGVYPATYPTWDFRLSYEEFAKGIIYDQSAPHSTDYEKIDYLTQAFYWDYEQVADYVANYTLTQRQTRAKNWYDRLAPIFGVFDAANSLKNPPYLPNADTTLQEIINLGHKLDPVLIAAIARNNRPRVRIIRKIGVD